MLETAIFIKLTLNTRSFSGKFSMNEINFIVPTKPRSQNRIITGKNDELENLRERVSEVGSRP